MAAPITQLRIFHRNFGSMYFLQESCKILARNIFLSGSCKKYIFWQNLARFVFFVKILQDSCKICICFQLGLTQDITINTTSKQQLERQSRQRNYKTTNLTLKTGPFQTEFIKNQFMTGNTFHHNRTDFSKLQPEEGANLQQVFEQRLGVGKYCLQIRNSAVIEN